MSLLFALLATVIASIATLIAFHQSSTESPFGWVANLRTKRWFVLAWTAGTFVALRFPRLALMRQVYPQFSFNYFNCVSSAIDRHVANHTHRVGTLES